MLDDDCIFLTRSILVRGLSKKQFNVLVDVSLKVGDLRNCAVDMTRLYKSSDDIHYKKVNYKSVISSVKKDLRMNILLFRHILLMLLLRSMLNHLMVMWN